MDQRAGIGVFQHPQRAIGAFFYIADAVAHIPAIDGFGAAMAVKGDADERHGHHAADETAAKRATGHCDAAGEIAFVNDGSVDGAGIGQDDAVRADVAGVRDRPADKAGDLDPGNRRAGGIGATATGGRNGRRAGGKSRRHDPPGGAGYVAGHRTMAGGEWRSDL